jgi:hypothetical protein
VLVQAHRTDKNPTGKSPSENSTSRVESAGVSSNRLPAENNRSRLWPQWLKMAIVREKIRPASPIHQTINDRSTCNAGDTLPCFPTLQWRKTQQLENLQKRSIGWLGSSVSEPLVVNYAGGSAEPRPQPPNATLKVELL